MGNPRRILGLFGCSGSGSGEEISQFVARTCSRNLPPTTKTPTVENF